MNKLINKSLLQSYCFSLFLKKICYYGVLIIIIIHLLTSVY